MIRARQSLLRKILRNFGIVLLTTLVAVLVRKLFLGALGTRIVWVTFYPAVVIASLYGGWFTGWPPPKPGKRAWHAWNQASLNTGS